MEMQWRWDLVLASWRPLLTGLGVGVGVAIAAMVVAVLAGLVVATLRTASHPAAWVPAFAYIQFFRGTSVYVLLLWIFFGLAVTSGIRLPAIAAAVVALGLLNSAYMAEIYRSGLKAVPRGQLEAAAALGLGRLQIYRDVVVPQLLPVILPAAANLFVDLLKDSAIIGAIGIEDLMRSADRLAKFHFHPFEFFTAASALYASVVLLFSSGVARRLELRYAPRSARP